MPSLPVIGSRGRAATRAQRATTERNVRRMSSRDPEIGEIDENRNVAIEPDERIASASNTTFVTRITRAYLGSLEFFFSIVQFLSLLVHIFFFFGFLFYFDIHFQHMHCSFFAFNYNVCVLSVTFFLGSLPFFPCRLTQTASRILTSLSIYFVLRGSGSAIATTESFNVYA